MTQRRPLTVAEREAIYRGKLVGKRLRDLADGLSCSFDCARKWWRVGRDQGLEGLRRSRRKRTKTGALSRFDPLVAKRALYWKRQHPKRGPTRILADLEKDRVLEGWFCPSALPWRTSSARLVPNCSRDANGARLRRPQRGMCTNSGKRMARRLFA